MLRSIRAELRANVDPKAKESFQRFFKESIRFYGVRTAAVRALAKKYWKEISQFDKKTIFAICEELLASDYTEEAFIVSFWLPMCVKSFEKSDLEIFERWIDTLHQQLGKMRWILQPYYRRFYRKISGVHRRNICLGRIEEPLASARFRCFVDRSGKKGKHLEAVFAIADLLLRDQDDMVQKGYGWLLKEASRKHLSGSFSVMS